MYKIIFSDLDETLLNDQHEICQRNVSAIQKAVHDYGIKFVPATGRGYMSITNVLTSLNLLDKEKEYVLSFNGGALTENKGHRLLDFQGLDFNKVNEIFQFGRQKDVCMQIYTLENLYVYHLNENEKERLTGQKASYQVIQEEDVYLLKDMPIAKIIYQNVDMDYLRALEPLMKDIVEGCCSLTYSSQRYMEFNKKGVDKGLGMKRLTEKLDIDIAETIAIGDNHNDIAMLKMAGLSVASGNAVAEVKAMCDYVCESDHNQGCVAEVIEKFILNQ